MKSLLKHGNLNEMAFNKIQQADGSVVTIPTQHHAEASLITHGPKPTKSGSTLPDLEIHLADGSKVNAEVKSGTTNSPLALELVTVSKFQFSTKVSISGTMICGASRVLLY